MRYGIAIWNFREKDKPLLDLVTEFADMGFTAISFQPEQIVELAADEASSLKRLLETRDLVTTLHGAPNTAPETLRLVVKRLGNTLRTITFDAKRKSDSRGTFYDVPPMLPVFDEIARTTEQVRFAVEDFPLDEKARSFYSADLAPLMGNPRFGILVDLGHMNMRLKRQDSSFMGLGPSEYLSGIPLPIVELHIHDNHGAKDSHGHLGFGNLDFAAVTNALKSVGFEGVSTIEIAPSFHNSTPKLSKPLAKTSLDTWTSLWES